MAVNSSRIYNFIMMHGMYTYYWYPSGLICRT